MPLDWLLDRFRGHETEDAVVWQDRTFTYGDLLSGIESAGQHLLRQGVKAGDVVILDADFSLRSIAFLLAAVDQRCIIVPIASHVKVDRERYACIAGARWSIRMDVGDDAELRSVAQATDHALLEQLREEGSPGLVLFSSGSTGEPKAALHNLDRLLNKFRAERHTQRLITFLLFDHIGGFNTMMYGLSNHGCVITLRARDAVAVCEAIERHRAEVLPASPTFLNLMLMSGAHRSYDLSSLKIINYATEVMSESLLKRLNEELPGVELRQSYGLTELGIMRSQTRSRDSTWIKVGGEDYQTRVVNNVLQIKATSSMMGYLNAPSPFTGDGWFDTGDEVDVDGEWIRFKGRRSEIINVGGEKVYPAEIESVILEVPNVADVTVAKERHPFTGHIVVAEIAPREGEDFGKLARRVRAHCFSKLPPFKVPVKIRLARGSRVSQRFKKDRLRVGDEETAVEPVSDPPEAS